MDAVLFGGDTIGDKAAMVERVTEYVRRFYENEVGETRLREWATQAVGNIWGDGPVVTKYVPMLAIREVRARVLDELEERLAAGEVLPPEAARDTWIWSAQHVYKDQAVAAAV